MHAAAARAARQPQPDPRAAPATASPADRARRRRARSGTRTRPRVARAGPRRPRPRRQPPPRNPLPGRSRPRRERARRARTRPIRHARPRLRASRRIRSRGGGRTSHEDLETRGARCPPAAGRGPRTPCHGARSDRGRTRRDGGPSARARARSGPIVVDPAVAVGEQLLEAAGPALRIVANFGVGLDHVDVDACRRRGVFVTNTPDVLTDATAELALALTLAAARRLTAAAAALRDGRWTSLDPGAYLGLELSGSCVGIVGIGRVRFPQPGGRHPAGGE